MTTFNPNTNMTWITYRKTFTSICKKQFAYRDEEIEALLSYALYLYQHGLPIIYDQDHLALLVGYQYDLLLRISNYQRAFYRKFTIPKKNGDSRVLYEPLPTLKEIQRWILDNILIKVPIHPAAKAYRAKTSVKDNAKFHRNQMVLLKMDIRNFFDSIREYHVYSLFKNIGYNRQVSTLLTKLCCLGNALPQGAPTSPNISNIVMKTADNQIFSYCRTHNIRYTRYADDMTFSGQFTPHNVYKEVSFIVRGLDLTINDDKVHVIRPNRRQEVTGIVVNQKLQVCRIKRMYLRQQVYYLKRYGIDDIILNLNNMSPESYLNKLIGLAGFIKFVNPKDIQAKKDVAYLKEIRNTLAM